MVERAAASRAAVAIREQVPADVGDQERPAEVTRPGATWTSSACQPLAGPPPPAIGNSNVPIAGGSTTPSTSIPSRSGAVARSASSTASSSVDADAAHPWHDP